jgi:acetoin utilization protein AcuB
MTPAVTTLTAEASVVDAVNLFGECAFRHIPVVDDDGQLCGIISDRDALRSMARKEPPLSTQVSAIMSRDLVTATPDTPLEDAIDLVVFHRINCLPVVDAGRLCGIVTTTDLLAAFHQLLHSSRPRRR